MGINFFEWPLMSPDFLPRCRRIAVDTSNWLENETHRREHRDRDGARDSRGRRYHRRLTRELKAHRLDTRLRRERVKRKSQYFPLRNHIHHVRVRIYSRRIAYVIPYFRYCLRPPNEKVFRLTSKLRARCRTVQDRACNRCVRQ